MPMIWVGTKHKKSDNLEEQVLETESESEEGEIRSTDWNNLQVNSKNYLELNLPKSENQQQISSRKHFLWRRYVSDRWIKYVVRFLRFPFYRFSVSLFFLSIFYFLFLIENINLKYYGSLGNERLARLHVKGYSVFLLNFPTKTKPRRQVLNHWSTNETRRKFTVCYYF